MSCILGFIILKFLYFLAVFTVPLYFHISYLYELCHGQSFSVFVFMSCIFSYFSYCREWQCNDCRQLLICCIQVEWPVKLQMAHEVILGMNYLRTRTPPVIHGDVKNQNVLIGDDYKAKVNVVSVSWRITPCPKISDTPSFKRAWFSLKFIDFNEISYTALS